MPDPENYAFTTASALLKKFSEVIPFGELPSLNEQKQSRAASDNGHAVVEVDGQVITVFLQLSDVPAIVVLQQTAIALLLFKYFLPLWQGGSTWLSAFMADQKRSTAEMSAGSDRVMKFRKTPVGLFVSIVPKA